MSKWTGRLGSAGKAGKCLEERTGGGVAASPTLKPFSTSRRVASFTACYISSRSVSPYFPLQPALSQASFPRLSYAFSPSRTLLSPLRPVHSPVKALQRPLLRAITSRKSITSHLQGSVSSGKLRKTGQKRREKSLERPANPSFTRLLQCEGHKGAITDFTVLHNTLVTGSTDYSLSYWTLPDLSPSPYHTIYPYPSRLQPTYTVQRAHKGPIWALQSLPGSKVATSGGDCRVKIWSGLDITQIFSPEVIIRALITPNNRQNEVLIGAGGEGTILTWDIETGKCIFERKSGHKGAIRCLIPVETDTYASGGEDFSISLWDIRTRAPVLALPGHTDTVLSLYSSPNNSLTSGSEDRTIGVWDVRVGTRLETGLVGERVNSVEPWAGRVLCAGLSLTIYKSDSTNSLQLDEGELLKVKASDLIYTSSRSCRLCIWALSP